MTLDEALKRRRKESDRLVRSIAFVRVADWLNSSVVSKHADKEALRKEWMAADDRWAGRSGWHITAERVAKNPVGPDLSALLDRLRKRPSRSARGWETIATIPFRRVARPPSRRSGSTPW
jgi:hypothetical protein